MKLIKRLRLISAVKAGDAAKVQRLLASGAEPESRNVQGLTALMVAASHGHVEVIDALIACGAAVNTRARVGNPGTTPVEDVTALMAACGDSAANVVVLERLIENGAHLDLVDSAGRTALMYAVLMGHDQLVKALVDAGADATIATSDGVTPLDAARDGNNVRVLKLLMAASAARRP